MSRLLSHYRSFQHACVTRIRTQAMLADRWIAITLIVIALSILLSWGVNTYLAHYPVQLFHLKPTLILAGCIALWGLAITLEKKYPYFGNLLIPIALSPFFWVILFTGYTAVLVSPFTHLIDPWLFHVDTLLGFHQLAFMKYIQHHPTLFEIARFSYSTLWITQITFIPFVLALFGCRRMVRLWALTILLTVFIGGLFYYFFPSLPPAIHLSAEAHNQHVHFISTSYAIVKRYIMIHHHQLRINHLHQHIPYPGLEVGLISFPSFHVAKAVLCSAIFWWARQDAKKGRGFLLFLCVAVTLANIPVILSTMALGYHYLMDVFAGALLTALSLYIASRLTRQEQGTRWVWPSRSLISKKITSRPCQ